MPGRISEREIKVAVDAWAAEALFAHVSGQPRLGGLPVTASEHLLLRDAYYDTADLLLWRTGGYLRIRREPKRSVVTFRLARGSPLTPETVETTRPLQELPRTIDDLIRHFPSLGPVPGDPPVGPPFLELTGLQPVVTLTNQRKRLSVQPPSRRSRYKVKLDTVAYGGWPDQLHEIELDVYDLEGIAWARCVIDCFRQQAPGAVRVSASTKLDRGLVLRELFERA